MAHSILFYSQETFTWHVDESGKIFSGDNLLLRNVKIQVKARHLYSYKRHNEKQVKKKVKEQSF